MQAAAESSLAHIMDGGTAHTHTHTHAHTYTHTNTTRAGCCRELIDPYHGWRNRTLPAHFLFWNAHPMQRQK